MEKSNRTKTYVIVACAIVIAAGIIIGYFFRSNSLSVKCTNGVFTGTTEKATGVLTFKGIPYAKAPIGELRWKAPVKPDASDERFDATDYGKVCIQTESTEHAWGEPMGEDCLTLNIWASDIKSKNKPVMVWIHGGSYGWGGTNDPLYDGQYLVDTYGDLIVITINYRINCMGFIDFSGVPGGEDFKDAPYLGILDQQMALTWIQENIENFGGDPDNVTIFGESAGGGSVSSLLAADGSEGLFKRAIIQSGAGLNHSKEKYDEKDQAGQLLKAAGATDMAGLMALSEEELYNAMCADTEVKGDESGSRVADLNNFPMRDDNLSIIPSDVSAAIAAKASDIDVMIGTTGDEMRYWVNEMECGDVDSNMEAYYDFVTGKVDGYKKKFPDAAQRIDDAVKNSNAVDDGKYSEIYKDIWKYTDVVSEVSFRAPTLQIVEERVKAGGNGKTYVYLFNKCSDANDWQGACHACELGYVFDNLVCEGIGGNTDPELAANVSAAWVAFARTGNPSTEQITWEEYNLDNRPTMVMGNDCTMKMEDDPKGELREALKDILIF